MPTKVKTLHVLYSFSDRLGRTGIGTTAWHQVQGLIDQGHRVTVYTPTCDRGFSGNCTVVETLRRGVLRAPLRNVGLYKPRIIHDWIVANRLKRVYAGIDVVHCWPSAALYTLNSAKAFGIPSFLERPNAHTRYAFEVVAREYRRLGLVQPARHSHTWDEDRLLREEAEYEAADQLLCPSEFVCETFEQFGFPPDTIARHQYGYDPARFPQPNSDQTSTTSLNIVFVGRCEPRKGLHYALDAWLMSDASRAGRFHIAGRFVPGYRELLAQQLAQPSVVEHGFTDDVPALMRRCDAVVLPSLEEGSALVTYEARACGCVLLVSQASGAPCEHMKTGMVHAPRDVATLAEHLTMLERNRELLLKLRRRSMESVASLTWQHAARVLASVYLRRMDAVGPAAVADGNVNSRTNA